MRLVLEAFPGGRTGYALEWVPHTGLDARMPSLEPATYTFGVWGGALTFALRVSRKCLRKSGQHLDSRKAPVTRPAQQKDFHMITRISLTLALALGLVACGGGEATEAEAETSTGGEMDQPMGNAATSDIVDTAVAAGSFSTLAAALQAAGLVDTLKGEGPFTVFAPTDEAFAALPEGTVENLLRPENRDQLVAVLTYHVVSGDVRAADVAGLTEATTVQGGSLAIDTSNGVRINDATVTQADIVCSNGVIHVIDKVLLPQ